MGMSTGPAGPFRLTPAQVGRARQVFARRGVVVLGPAAIDLGVFAALVAESRTARQEAVWKLTERAAVPQDTLRGHFGPRCRAFLESGSELAGDVVGEDLVPSWSASCLTYYERPGQWLARHIDKESACRYAMLVYLDVTGDGEPAGRRLHIRLAGDEGDLVVTAVPNRVVLLHGARLAHHRPPLCEGESVSLLAGCLSRRGEAGLQS